VSDCSLLLSIVAHARVVALDRAWAMFRDSGVAGMKDDSAGLNVHDRLLGDRALAARARSGGLHLQTRRNDTTFYEGEMI